VEERRFQRRVKRRPKRRGPEKPALSEVEGGRSSTAPTALRPAKHSAATPLSLYQISPLL
jgi:hypothetical protein